MTEAALNIPPGWERVNFSRLGGILMVLGAPDVGKSTFARYLYRRLCAASSPVAYLDGDPGQSSLGPPATMTLGLSADGGDYFPPQGRVWRSFVGALSPRGHMLAMLTGAFRLVIAAREARAQAVIYDTSGFVAPAGGGTHLKLAKIDLLRPAALFAIQRQQELENLLAPLRRTRRVQVIDLSPSPAAKRRDASIRRAHRAEKFALYFRHSHLLMVNWLQFAVFPAPSFAVNRLVALEDADGFTIGLGIVEEIEAQAKQVLLHTPLSSMKGVEAIRLGDLAVDPQTFEDRHLSPAGVSGWT